MPTGGEIKRAVRELVAPGVLLLAARTGFTRREILHMQLRHFVGTVRALLPKES